MPMRIVASYYFPFIALCSITSIAVMYLPIDKSNIPEYIFSIVIIAALINCILVSASGIREFLYQNLGKYLTLISIAAPLILLSWVGLQIYFLIKGGV